MRSDESVTEQIPGPIDASEIERLLRKRTDLLTPAESAIWQIHVYAREVAGEEGFLQWLRWSQPESVMACPELLIQIGALTSADICRDALKAAFPSGAPDDPQAYEDRLHTIVLDDAERATRDRLDRLALRQLAVLDEVTACLAAWARTRIASDPEAATGASHPSGSGPNR